MEQLTAALVHVLIAIALCLVVLGGLGVLLAIAWLIEALVMRIWRRGYNLYWMQGAIAEKRARLYREGERDWTVRR